MVGVFEVAICDFKFQAWTSSHEQKLVYTAMC